MAIVHVALVGATGNLGPAVLKALVAAPLKLTILTRNGSASKLPSNVTRNAQVNEVDYESQTSLVQALSGVNVIVRTLGFNNLLQIQKNLIDAAIIAGVNRFIPSEFGNDTANALVKTLPLYADKVKTQEYLVLKTSERPDFSYTFCYTNSFLDWQLKMGFMVNLKEHTAVLYDGGDVPFSATRLDTVGKAVVQIVSKLEATKNRHIYVHDVRLTQNQLLSIAKDIDGKDWATSIESTEQIERQAREAWARGRSEEQMSATLGCITRACWGPGFGGDFRSKLSNDMLEIPQVTEDELQVLVREIMAA